MTFRDREGHANVPYKHVEAEDRLGLWCSHQRTAKKEGKLSDEQVAQLSALDFVWDPLTTQWEAGFAKLGEFVAREGHANVASKHIEGEYSLGEWCRGQRRAYKKGSLSEERIARLEVLRFQLEPKVS